MRITYLTNRYPAVSHTFVRRELQALERLGYEVQRLTIRADPGKLVDPDDQAEAARTTALLGGSRLALVGRACGEALRRPARTVRTFVFAIRLARRTRIALPKMLAYLGEALILVGLCTRHQSELLRVHFGTNGAVIARLARRLGGPPFSVAIHGPDEFDAPQRWDLGGLVAESLFTTAITHYCAAQLMRWTEPVHWPRIVIVRCVVDPAFLLPAPLPSDDHGRRLCTVARLAPQKGLPLLLDGLAEALRRGADLSLDIVGDGPARASLEEQVRRLGLAGRVLFHGALSGADVRRIITASHAMVLASFAEGLPVVLMEATGLGRPALATAIAGIPELIRDGETGWLVPAGDADALADALIRVSEAELTELDRLGRAAHDACRAVHATERQAAVLDAAIRSRLGPPEQVRAASVHPA